MKEGDRLTAMKCRHHASVCSLSRTCSPHTSHEAPDVCVYTQRDSQQLTTQKVKVK